MSNIYSGLIYEPRAFWDVVSITQPADLGTGENRARFNRENFHNGTRHPIILTKITTAPINYIYREWDGDGTNIALNYHNCGLILNVAKFLISAPFRQHYSRRLLLSSAWPAEPTGEPSLRVDTDQSFIYSSGIFNLAHWKFDKPLVLPRNGAIRFDLGAFPTKLVGYNSADADDPRVSIAYYEDGDSSPQSWPGQGRSVVARQMRTIDDGFQGANLPGDGFPVLAQGFTRPWPTGTRFTSRDFHQQESGRAGSNRFTGMGLHIDQIIHDDQIDAALLNGAQGGEPITSLLLRTGCRIMTTDGGTQQWWFREGCPPALIFNHITPAKVYTLPEPITLGPGDTLDVELEVPLPHDFAAQGGIISPTYNLGICFSGYAAIEG